MTISRTISYAEVNVTSPSSAPTCGGLAPGVVSLPIDQIERAIRLTDAQTAILNDLKAASTQADNILRASCPTEISLTPVARLDAVAKQIQAMSEAVQILRAPLTMLYNSLNDEQKDRFAAIGTETKYRRARISRRGIACERSRRFVQAADGKLHASAGAAYRGGDQAD